MTFTVLTLSPVVFFKTNEKWYMFLIFKRCLLRDRKSQPPEVMQWEEQRVTESHLRLDCLAKVV